MPANKCPFPGCAKDAILGEIYCQLHAPTQPCMPPSPLYQAAELPYPLANPYDVEGKNQKKTIRGRVVGISICIGIVSLALVVVGIWFVNVAIPFQLAQSRTQTYCKALLHGDYNTAMQSLGVQGQKQGIGVDQLRQNITANGTVQSCHVVSTSVAKGEATTTVEFLFSSGSSERHVYKLFDDGVTWQEYVNGSNTWRINVEGWSKQF